MSQIIYIFSGLGADYRVFQNLKFHDYEIVHIHWIPPLAGESIEVYAKRLLIQIKTPQPILIGLSLGGMMAMEVAKLIDTPKVILISSVKTKFELPFYYRLVGHIGIHRLIPTSFLKRSSFITNWFFGVQNNLDKKLLKDILQETDKLFLNWAIDKIVNWSNITVLENIYHIHGSNDRILPAKYLTCNALIKDGGHLMILNRSSELNILIHQTLNTHFNHSTL